MELCQVAGSVKLSQPVPPIIRSLSPCTGELGGLFPKTGRLLPLLLLVYKVSRFRPVTAAGGFVLPGMNISLRRTIQTTSRKRTQCWCACLVHSVQQEPRKRFAAFALAMQARRRLIGCALTLKDFARGIAPGPATDSAPISHVGTIYKSELQRLRPTDVTAWQDKSKTCGHRVVRCRFALPRPFVGFL